MKRDNIFFVFSSLCIKLSLWTEICLLFSREQIQISLIATAEN